MSLNKKVNIIDTTLRDGSHAIHHQYTKEDIINICSGLERGGVYAAEVGHGAGVGGSILTFGLAKTTDREMLTAAASVLKNTKLSVLLVPGLGTMKDLELAADCGVKQVRVAVHCTEVDVGEQHIKLAKKLGLEAISFSMMTHMTGPMELAEQAKMAESYGADVFYMADSSGAMIPREIVARVEALKKSVSIPIGVHTHNNMSLAIGNTMSAIDAGVEFVDGTLQGLGAGCGNAQSEVLAAILHKAGVETGCDFYALMDVGERFVRPLIKHPLEATNESLIMGYSGLYSSFYLHTIDVAKRFGVDPRDIMIELGKRKVVGGQEDQIIDVAYQFQQQQLKGDKQ